MPKRNEVDLQAKALGALSSKARAEVAAVLRQYDGKDPALVVAQLPPVVVAVLTKYGLASATVGEQLFASWAK